MDEDNENYEPTLQNILDKTTLKWIFVGGKGGVGKTTCSCSLAIQLSKVRHNVLIISTDPAHNLSDAFEQKFTKSPMPVKGFENLFAMEIDPTVEQDDLDMFEKNSPEASFFQDLSSAIPGIDEAMSFAEVMKQVQSMEFSVIVFDTAPTGHTLRFLSFPSVLEKGLSKIFSLKSKFGGIFQQVSSLVSGSGETEEQMASKLDITKKVIEEVNLQFSNPDLTTFICVCIPEFLSLYETERLIQELVKFKIDSENIIINQVLYPEKDSQCKLCNSRFKMQQKYLDQADDLYEDFHKVKLPLLHSEIRGIELLTKFSQYLLTSYTPNEK